MKDITTIIEDHLEGNPLSWNVEGSPACSLYDNYQSDWEEIWRKNDFAWLGFREFENKLTDEANNNL